MCFLNTDIHFFVFLTPTSILKYSVVCYSPFSNRALVMCHILPHYIVITPMNAIENIEIFLLLKIRSENKCKSIK